MTSVPVLYGYKTKWQAVIDSRGGAKEGFNRSKRPGEAVCACMRVIIHVAPAYVL